MPTLLSLMAVCVTRTVNSGGELGPRQRAANASPGVVSLAMAVGMWQVASMKTKPSAYHGFRFPAAIISHAVWLYHCFSMSLREVELILAQCQLKALLSRSRPAW